MCSWSVAVISVIADWPAGWHKVSLLWNCQLDIVIFWPVVSCCSLCLISWYHFWKYKVLFIHLPWIICVWTHTDTCSAVCWQPNKCVHNVVHKYRRFSGPRLHLSVNICNNLWHLNMLVDLPQSGWGDLCYHSVWTQYNLVFFYSWAMLIHTYVLSCCLLFLSLVWRCTCS